MFDTASLILFISSSWLLILSPGPDSIYVLTRGISLGRKAGIISALGVTLGIFVHTAFAALGISVILMTSSTLFLIVKTAGTLYLIYIGIRTIMDKKKIAIEKDIITNKKNSNLPAGRQIFLQGVLSNTLNPKVALFFLSYLPQFVNKETFSGSLQMLMLGTIFATFGVIYLLLLGYFSGRIGQWINTKEGMMKKIQIISGSILIGLGIRLAFIQRNQ
jgi:threonine/homoserine/homoserine lactone efflux protein